MASHGSSLYNIDQTNFNSSLNVPKQLGRSPEIPRPNTNPPSLLTELIKEEGLLLESSQKVKAMTREYLTQCILTFFEDYSKQKTITDFPAAYFLKYLSHQRQMDLASLKKTANALAISLGYYAQTSHEMKYFNEVFNRKTCMVRAIGYYLYCRRIVKAFFPSKSTLDDVKLPLDTWITLVKKIFRNQPATEVVDRMKEKISDVNNKKILDQYDEKKAFDTRSRNLEVSIRMRTQIYEIDAIHFVILCVDELQNDPKNTSRAKGSKPYEQTSRLSPSPPKQQIKKENVNNKETGWVINEDELDESESKHNEEQRHPRYNQNKYERPQRSHTPIPYNSFLDTDNLNSSQAGVSTRMDLNTSKRDKKHEGAPKEAIDLSFIINKRPFDHTHNQKIKDPSLKELESLMQDRISLKKELAVQTVEKRTSLEILLRTLQLYDGMVKENTQVHSFLKQMQSDFSKVMSKVKATEPQIFKDINPKFVKKFVNNRPKEPNANQVKYILNIKNKFETKIDTSKFQGSQETVEAQKLSLERFQPKILLSQYSGVVDQNDDVSKIIPAVSKPVTGNKPKEKIGVPSQKLSQQHKTDSFPQKEKNQNDIEVRKIKEETKNPSPVNIPEKLEDHKVKEIGPQPSNTRGFDKNSFTEKSSVRKELAQKIPESQNKVSLTSVESRTQTIQEKNLISSLEKIKSQELLVQKTAKDKSNDESNQTNKFKIVIIPSNDDSTNKFEEVTWGKIDPKDKESMKSNHENLIKEKEIDVTKGKQSSFLLENDKQSNISNENKQDSNTMISEPTIKKEDPTANLISKEHKSQIENSSVVSSSTQSVINNNKQMQVKAQEELNAFTKDNQTEESAPVAKFSFSQTMSLLEGSRLSKNSNQTSHHNNLPAGAVPIKGTLPPPPSITLNSSLHLIMVGADLSKIKSSSNASQDMISNNAPAIPDKKQNTSASETENISTSVISSKTNIASVTSALEAIINPKAPSSTTLQPQLPQGAVPIKANLATPPQINLPSSIQILLGSAYEKMLAENPVSAVKANNQSFPEKTQSIQKPADAQQGPATTSIAKSSEKPQASQILGSIIKGNLPLPPKITLDAAISLISTLNSASKVTINAVSDEAFLSKIKAKTEKNESFSGIKLAQDQKKSEIVSQSETNNLNKAPPSDKIQTTLVTGSIIKGNLAPPPKITLGSAISLVANLNGVSKVTIPSRNNVSDEDFLSKIKAKAEKSENKPETTINSGQSPSEIQPKTDLPTNMSTTPSIDKIQTTQSMGPIIKGNLPPPPKITLDAAISLISTLNSASKVTINAVSDEAFLSKIKAKTEKNESFSGIKLAQDQKKSEIVSQSETNNLNKAPPSDKIQTPQFTGSIIKGNLAPPPKITLDPAISLVANSNSVSKVTINAVSDEAFLSKIKAKTEKSENASETALISDQKPKDVLSNSQSVENSLPNVVNLEELKKNSEEDKALNVQEKLNTIQDSKVSGDNDATESQNKPVKPKFMPPNIKPPNFIKKTAES